MKTPLKILRAVVITAAGCAVVGTLAFGVIAFINMAPLISLGILGGGVFSAITAVVYYDFPS